MDAFGNSEQTIENTKKTILIVEDHGITRLGLRMLLQQESSVSVVGEAVDGPESVEKALTLVPDIVLMDIGLPGFDGIEATRRIKAKLANTKIIIFTSHQDRLDVESSFSAAADGYCLKDAGISNIVEAIKVVAAGGTWYDEKIVQKFGVPNRDNCAGRSHDSGTNLSPIAAGVLASQDLPLGAVIGCKYSIESLIGRGPKGKTYKGHDSSSGNAVAIRVLNRFYEYLPTTLDIKHSAQNSLQPFEDPGLLQYFHFGKLDCGNAYIVSRIIEAPTLADVGKDCQTLSLPEFQRCFVSLSKTVASMHRAGFVHGDIKPSNIFLQRWPSEPATILADFGVVRKALATGMYEENKSTTGLFTGNPQYMSPEQCRGGGIDQRSDIYSIGCVMYESLTGHPVFSGDTWFELLSQQLSEAPEPMLPAKNLYNLPKFISNVVFRCLQKDPGLRFQTAAELSHYLEIDLEAISAAS